MESPFLYRKFRIYDIIMSPEDFEIKNKDLRPLKMVKNRQLSTVLLNLTTVVFGRESVNRGTY